MAQPPAYTPQTDFSTDESNNVGGRSTVRTAMLDAEMSALNVTLDALLANLALIQRDDGQLRDTTVRLFTLSADVLALLASYGATPRGAWLTATAYALKDLVSQSGNTYIAVTAHTSGVFATDLAADKWLLFSLNAAPSATQVTFTPTATLAATNAQTAIAEADTENRALSAAAAAAATALDVALRGDLASTSDAAKGDALIGVKRAETNAVGRTLHFYIQHSKLLMANYCDPTADTATQVATALANAITDAKAGGKTLEFDPGATYTTNAEWAILGSNGIRGLRLWGNGCTIYRNTGAGPVVSMSAGAGVGVRCDDHELLDFVLKGNAASTYGLYTKGLVRSRLHNLRVVDVATAGMLMEWGVLNDTRNFMVSNNVDTFTVNPTKGIILDQANASATYQSTANTFFNAIIEGPISNVGIDIVAGSLNVFSGGSSENIPRGALIGAACMENAFTNGFDFEGNSVYDVQVNGKRTQFTDMQAYSGASSSPAVMIGSTAEETCFKGSTLFRVDLDATSKGTTFFGCALNDSGPNGITGTGPYQAWGTVKIDANYLKTSEQDFGAWTPGIIGGTTAGAQTYGGSNIGYYQRNGRVVNVQFNCAVLTNAGGTGTATLTGLPFTSLNVTNMIVQAVLAENSGVTFAGTNDRVVVQLNPNAVIALLTESVGGKSAAALPIGSIAAGSYAGQFSYISNR